jgi:hypothetical protein
MLSSEVGDDEDDEADAGANPAAATCDASAANSMRMRLPEVRNEEEQKERKTWNVRCHRQSRVVGTYCQLNATFDSNMHLWIAMQKMCDIRTKCFCFDSVGKAETDRTRRGQ